MKEIARLFKALSDETRLRILRLLNVSRHMAYLKNAGLVDDRREAVWVYYSLTEPKNQVHACQLRCLGECFDNYEDLKRDEARLEEFKLKGTCASPRSQG
jgi:ArsR family transcriptional regulator